ncbi:LSU ribosomal protein L27p, mitochondrial [Candidatus Hydrogenisulfobacillus filiaventi]|uniref:LSU ribosomal protein L27p, mitochondrial n=1 Tax=Candidatus Hydrogenisulfobacillus filiaventi TaxID=2707344 RepID=A0A6F8ZHD2_9FIRM|nr:LSU ribosomal protein L27p, mitochondrial [Candidatus Hydrogenisulfobacillus filiaventi]
MGAGAAEAEVEDEFEGAAEEPQPAAPSASSPTAPKAHTRCLFVIVGSAPLLDWWRAETFRIRYEF